MQNQNLNLTITRCITTNLNGLQICSKKNKMNEVAYYGR
jgi:hypothetical protein